MDWNAFITLLKEFKDFVFRPFTLLTFGFIGLILLTLPEPYLGHLRLANFVGQYGTPISIGTIFLLATGSIRLCDVYIFSWRRQRIELKKSRENFQRQLATLSIYELSILAYCLSRNRITFFVVNTPPPRRRWLRCNGLKVLRSSRGRVSFIRPLLGSSYPNRDFGSQCTG